MTPAKDCLDAFKGALSSLGMCDASVRPGYVFPKIKIEPQCLVVRGRYRGRQTYCPFRLFAHVSRNRAVWVDAARSVIESLDDARTQKKAT